MDTDEACDYADQFPLSDRDMEEDNQILAALLKRIPSCITVSDIDQLLQDIPVQPPLLVPVRTVQEAVAAGYLPPLDVDAAKVFSLSEHILQEHVGKHDVNAVELKDLIQRVYPDFNPPKSGLEWTAGELNAILKITWSLATAANLKDSF